MMLVFVCVFCKVCRYSVSLCRKAQNVSDPTANPQPASKRGKVLLLITHVNRGYIKVLKGQRQNVTH